MVNDRKKDLDQKMDELQKLSKTNPEVSSVFDQLLMSLNVETDAAMENAKRVRELSTLSKFTQDLNSAATSDIDAILKLVYEQTARLMKTEHFFVAFYDNQNDKISFPYVVENGEFKKPEGDWVSRKAGKGLTEYIIKNREPLFIPTDIDEWLGKHEKDVKRIGTPAKSWLGVPMIARDEIIGVITVQDYMEEKVFDDHDKNILFTIASQATIAIENSKLFQSAQHQTEEAFQLRKVSESITSTIEISKVLKGVVEGARTVMKADLVALYPIIQGTFESNAIIEGKTFAKHERDELPKPGGLANKVLKEGFLVIENVEEMSGMINNFVEEEKIRSFAGISLRVGGNVVNGGVEGGESVGVLYVNYRNLKTFDEIEHNTIYLFAIQAATAIQNARLFDRRDKEIKAIERINRAITTEKPDLVFDRIVDATIEIINVPTSHLLIVDDSGEYLEIKAYQSLTKITNLKQKYKVGKEGISGWVAKNKKPALIPDVNHLDPKFEKFYLTAATDTKSSLTVPLLNVDGQLLGILNMESDRLNAFTINDQTLLQVLAEQASTSILNQKRYEQLKALQEIDESIIAEDELDPILDLILEKALRLIGVGFGDIRLTNPTTKELVVKTVRYLDKLSKVDTSLTRVLPNEGIIGASIIKKKSIIVNDTKKDDRYISYFKGMRSEIAVPLIMDSEVLGVINLESPQVNSFSAQDKSLLEALAGQAVIAILNVRSHERAENEAERFKVLHRAGVELGQIGDISDIKKAHKIIVKTIHEHMHSAQTVIRCVDEKGQELVVVEAMQTGENSPYESVKIDEGLNGFVAQTKKTQVVHDVNNPPEGVKVNQSDKEINSLVVAPIQFEDHYYGNLGLSHQDIGHFTDPKVELIEGLSNRLAITLRRLDVSDAHQIAEQRAGEAEVMGSIGQGALELAHRLGNELGLVRTNRNNVIDELEVLNVENPYIEEQLDEIVSSTQKILDLSKGLEDEFKSRSTSLSEQQEGEELPIKRELISMSILLKDAKKSYQGLPKNIKVQFEIEKELPQVRVYSDKIADALRNLFTNAIQAMPEGGTITMRGKSIDNNFVEIEVEDTGIGIEEAKLPRIFDLFFTTKGSFGFGLWSVRANTFAEGGDLEVKSEPGIGTTFTMTLPIAED